jgi:hypothetical protein
MSAAACRATATTCAVYGTPGTTSSAIEAAGHPHRRARPVALDTDQGPRLLYGGWPGGVKRRSTRAGASTLNDVVCNYLNQQRRREEAYTRLRSIMREVTLAPPMALRQLAQITDFDLFITTTFDPLLEQAVNLERFAGQPHAEVIAYAPNRVSDLPAEGVMRRR